MPPRTTSSSPIRRGLTLVELLVALLLLVVGLLAVVGTTAELMRAESRAAADSRAAATLAARVERTAASTCVDTAGVSIVLPFTEQWRTWTIDSLRWLADTVRFPIAGDPSRSQALVAPVRCRP